MQGKIRPVRIRSMWGVRRDGSHPFVNRVTENLCMHGFVFFKTKSKIKSKSNKNKTNKKQTKTPAGVWKLCKFYVYIIIFVLLTRLLLVRTIIQIK